MAVTRELRTLLTGLTLSWVGDAFQQVALPVAVVLAGGSAGQLAAVMTAQFGVRLVFMLLGGVAADRFSPRRQMILADVGRMVSAIALAWLFWSGHWSTLGLVACTVVSSVCGSFFAPAFMVLRTAMTEPRDRQQVNGLLTTIRTSAQIVGPVAGGAVVAATTPTLAFGVNAATYLASIGAVLVVRRNEPASPASGSSMWQDLREGARAVLERGWLTVGLLAASVYHLANGVLLVIVPLFVVKHLGGGTAYGLVSGAEAAGGLVGALVAMRHRVRHPLRWGWSALALIVLWPLSFVWPQTLPAVLAATIVAYAGLFYFDTHWGTAVQTVPERLLGRVSAIDSVTSFVMLPVGSSLAPLLTHVFGLRPTILVCAAVLLGAGLSPLLFRSVRSFTLEPA